MILAKTIFATASVIVSMLALWLFSPGSDLPTSKIFHPTSGDAGLLMTLGVNLIIVIVGIVVLRTILKQQIKTPFSPIDLLAHGTFIVIGLASAFWYAAVQSDGSLGGILFLISPGLAFIVLCYAFLRNLYAFYKSKSMMIARIFMCLALLGALLTLFLLFLA